MSEHSVIITSPPLIEIPNELLLLREYFEKNALQYKETQVGYLIPSNIIHIYFGLRYFLEHQYIDASKAFVDAGCGDGRVLLVLDLLGFQKIIGIEYDAEIFHHAVAMVEEYMKIKNAPSRIQITQGDFLCNETYGNIDTSFSDIPIFFNFKNNHDHLARKIYEQSSLKTECIIYGPKLSNSFYGLKHRISLELIDITREIPFLPKNCKGFPQYLNLFFK